MFELDVCWVGSWTIGAASGCWAGGLVVGPVAPRVADGRMLSTIFLQLSHSLVAEPPGSPAGSGRRHRAHTELVVLALMNELPRKTKIARKPEGETDYPPSWEN